MSDEQKLAACGAIMTRKAERTNAMQRTNESQAAFQKAAEDASKESWANLWYAEVAGHAENGVWDGSVVLYRRNSQ